MWESVTETLKRLLYKAAIMCQVYHYKFNLLYAFVDLLKSEGHTPVTSRCFMFLWYWGLTAGPRAC